MSDPVAPTRRQMMASALALGLPALAWQARAAERPALQAWPLNTPSRTGIHDMAPAPDGEVWFQEGGTEHISVIRHG